MSEQKSTIQILAASSRANRANTKSPDLFESSLLPSICDFKLVKHNEMIPRLLRTRALFGLRTGNVRILAPRRTLIAAPKPGDGPLMSRRADRELPGKPFLRPYKSCRLSEMQMSNKAA